MYSVDIGIVETRRNWECIVLEWVGECVLGRVGGQKCIGVSGCQCMCWNERVDVQFVRVLLCVNVCMYVKVCRCIYVCVCERQHVCFCESVKAKGYSFPQAYICVILTIQCIYNMHTSACKRGQPKRINSLHTCVKQSQCFSSASRGVSRTVTSCLSLQF